MKLIDFGESIIGYDVKVINERVARAGAGILFVLGLVTFINSFLTHDFALAQVVITLFMFDFFIRVFINPKFAPSLILGYFFVRKQAPEYVGASQKRFAWGIGFVLALIMFSIVVIAEIMTPIKLIICILCLVLLFAESAFGICLGCKIYHMLNKETMYCAGGCEVSNLPKLTLSQWIVFVISVALIIIGFKYFHTLEVMNDNTSNAWSNKMSDMNSSKPCEHCEHKM